MPAETVSRRWTVATWLVAGAGDDISAVTNALRSLNADAVTLQSIREADARKVAESLEYDHAWELSYYPQTPLMRASAVGLCVLSPHQVAYSESAPISDRTSTWSRQRRIAQAAIIRRPDHTEYRFLHRVGARLAAEGVDTMGNAVIITPEQVGVDAAHAIVVPEAARVVTSQVERPIATVAPLQATMFEMDWVQGDLPV